MGFAESKDVTFLRYFPADKPETVLEVFQQMVQQTGGGYAQEWIGDLSTIPSRGDVSRMTLIAMNGKLGPLLYLNRTLSNSATRLKSGRITSSMRSHVLV